MSPRFMMAHTAKCLTLILPLLLSACGSDSGSTSTPTTSTPTPDVTKQCNTVTQQAMLDAVNAVRRQGRMCGNQFYAPVPALTWNGRLAQAAALHSKDMADNNYFSHTSQDGRSLAQRVTNAGYQWRAVGENISAGRNRLDDTIQGWIDSPGHCANMMSPNFEEIGMACAINDNSRYKMYWTQKFASPRS